MSRALVVAIPTRGRPVLLDRTLASLAGAARPSGYRGTFVIENGAADAEVARVAHRWRDDLGVTFRSIPEGNKSAALNGVLDSVGDDLIVFLDDDVRVVPGLLEAYAAADAVWSAARVYFGGPVAADYEAPPPDWLRAYLPSSAVGWRWEGDPALVDQPDFLGFNWAARAADLRAVGGFDAGFGPGARTGATGQERNMQTRLLAAGWTGRFVDAALVWHYVPRTRCSRRWALRRAYRNGVSSGLLETFAPGSPLWGAPRWLVRSVAESAFRAVGAQLRWSPERRFAAIRELLYGVGQLRGVRLRARRERTAERQASRPA